LRASLPSRPIERVCPPQNQRGPTVTSVRTLRRAQPSSTRAACASGMPMKAAGSASARHCFQCARAGDAGIDQHRHRARLEQREHQYEQLAATDAPSARCARAAHDAGAKPARKDCRP
jgi:hypothetical protein